jgi:hypothetical protein
MPQGGKFFCYPGAFGLPATDNQIINIMPMKEMTI